MMLLFRSLRAKLIAAFAVMAVVVAIGWLVPLTPPPQFEAAARIWIQSKLPSEYSKDSGAMFQSFMTYFNSPLMTACEVLKSQVVLEEARKRLASKIPSSQIPSIGQLKGGMSVEAVSGTDILRVAYNSSQPDVAVTVVQAVLDSFGKLETTQATASAVQSQAFLRSQLKEAHDRLSEIKRQIREFQAKNGTVDVNHEVELAVEQRNDLQQKLHESQADIQDHSIRKQRLEQRLGLSAGDADQAASVAAELAGDSFITQARNRITAIQIEKNALSGQLKPQHPRIQQLQRLEDRLNSQLQARLGNIGGSEGNSATRRNNRFANTDIRALQNLADYDAAEAASRTRQNSLASSLSSLDQKMKGYPSSQLEFAELGRAQKVAFEQITELEKGISSARLIEALNSQIPSFRVVDAPEITNVLIASNRPKLLTAGLLGLIFGIAIFFVLDLFDPRVRRIPAVLDQIPLPVVGWIPQFASIQSEGQLEAMHRARLRLRSLMSDKDKTIVVTSSDIADGKTSLAAGLALSLAQSGKNVLLVDADTTSASLHTRFKLPLSPGLSDYLSNPQQQTWSKIQHAVAKNLTVIPAGSKAGPGSVSVLSTDGLPDLMRKAAAQADVVIYDTPASSESPAAFALLSREVTLIVVVRLDHTHMPDLKILASQLKQHDCSSSALFLAGVNDYGVASALSKIEKQSLSELELV